MKRISERIHIFFENICNFSLFRLIHSHVLKIFIFENWMNDDNVFYIRKLIEGKWGALSFVYKPLIKVSKNSNISCSSDFSLHFCSIIITVTAIMHLKNPNNFHSFQFRWTVGRKKITFIFFLIYRRNMPDSFQLAE